MRRLPPRARCPTRPISCSAIPFNPLSLTPFGKNVAAGAELFERMTRRYGKPVFGLDTTMVDGVAHDVLEEIVWTPPVRQSAAFRAPDRARSRGCSPSC